MHEVRRIEANGLSIAYIEDGPPDGPLALCLHGFPDHALSYEPLLRDLGAAGFHAVAPWMRGYSPTSKPADGAYQSASLALDALAVADALAPDREAVIVGHDWGASGAYLAVAHRPERFRKIVTMAVPPTEAIAGRFILTPAQLKRSWYIFFFQNPLAEVAVSANELALIDMLWADWSPGFSPPAAFMRSLKETLSSSLDAAIGFYRTMFGTVSHDPGLAAVQSGGPVPVPALYLHGLDDGCLGAELIVPSELPAFFPGGLEVEMVPGAGHFLHLERPEVVNPRIVSFLTSPA